MRPPGILIYLQVNFKMFQGTLARLKRDIYVLTQYTRQVGGGGDDQKSIHSHIKGNLGRVDFINDYEYDLFIRPDTCNPRYRSQAFLRSFDGKTTLLPQFCRFWFNFSVDNVHVDQRIIFNIVNLSKTRNLFTLGLTPIVRSSSRPKWSRISLFVQISS